MALSRTISGNTKESGFAAHPEHTIRIEPAGIVLIIEGGGCKLAETARGLVLREAAYFPVFYFPRDEIDMSAFVRTDHSTWCPFKGEASYYSIDDDPALENAAWSYEGPVEESAALASRLAFYGDKVSISVRDV